MNSSTYPIETARQNYSALNARRIDVGGNQDGARGERVLAADGENHCTATADCVYTVTGTETVQRFDRSEALRLREAFSLRNDPQLVLPML
jgi:hypothetical protein